MEYNIEIKVKGVWYWCWRCLDVQHALKVIEALFPNQEFRAIPVFETRYVAR